MTELNEIELAEVVGGVIEGPNGEGCTEPHGTGTKSLQVGF